MAHKFLVLMAHATPSGLIAHYINMPGIVLGIAMGITELRTNKYKSYYVNKWLSRRKYAAEDLVGAFVADSG